MKVSQWLLSFIVSIIIFQLPTLTLTAQKTELQFNSNNTFKIIQFTDTHFYEGGKRSPEVLENIKAVMDAEKPDLVVLTGDIVTGNVTELKTLATALKNNQLRVLIGVKDDKYQGIYTGYFGRVKPQRDDLFVKALNDEYSQFKNHDFKKHRSTCSYVSPSFCKLN